MAHPVDERSHWKALQYLHSYLSVEGVSRSVIENGTDELLCRQIGTLSPALLPIALETVGILWTRASSDDRLQSLRRNLPFVEVLVLLWERFASDIVVLRPIIDILRVWSKAKCSKLKTHLIQQVPLLSRVRCSLLREIRLDEVQRVYVASLWKDLTLRASEKDATYLFQRCKDVLFTLCLEQSIAMKEVMSSIFWNLATSIPRTMADNEQVLEILQSFFRVDTRCPRGVVILRNASSALGTMVSAFTTGYVPELFATQTWIVHGMIHVMSDKTDLDCRRRCLRIVRCLASCQWGRDLCREEPDLVEVLVSRVLRNEQDQLDTRMHASQALSFLVAQKDFDWNSYGPMIESSLVESIEKSVKGEKLVLACCKTLCHSIEASPWNRTTSCFTPQFWRNLDRSLRGASDDPSLHIGAIEMMSLLADSEGGDGLLVCESALDVLCTLLDTVGPDYELPRQQSIRQLTLLLKNDSHRKVVVKHERLISTLVNFCIVNRGEAKEEVKALIVTLVPEL